MRRVHDELEERRMIRLLEGAVADVSELAPAEVRFLLAGARRGRRHARRHGWAVHRMRLLAPAAAAAGIAAVVLAGGSIPRSASHDAAGSTATPGIVVFPEASALQLLLAHRRGSAA